MNAERDKFLMKAIGREIIKPTHGNCCTCQTCGHFHDECICVDFDTWEGKGVLVDYLERTGQLEMVLVSLYQKWKRNNQGFNCFTHLMFNPTRFADDLAEFLRERERK